MTDKIPLAGVLGSPVAHSKSPMLHGHWLKRYGIPGHYVPMHVAQDDLEEVLAALPKLGFVGVNVTIPHKERVLHLAQHVTDRASVIGAANTLIFREDGSIHADNTDGYGFLENVKQNAPQWDPTAGPAAIFGAGGAARAVVAAMIEVGAPEVRISNRTKPRSEALASEFGAKVQVFDWVQAANMVDDAATVVNTTSLGMTGKQPFRIPLVGLSSAAVVSDLVYTPLDTDFLQAARAEGCTTVDGLGMLLHQAVPGFQRWFGKKPEVDAETRSVLLRG